MTPRSSPSRPPRDPARRARVRRRVIRLVTGLSVTALLLGGALVLLDLGARDFVETRAQEEIDKRLPQGSADVEVSVTGFSFLQQAVGGSLDRVDLGFSLGAEGVSAMARQAGFVGSLVVAEGGLIASGSTEIAGAAVPYTVTLEPSLDEGWLVLTATALSADELPELDLSPYIDLSTLSARVCTASLLPRSISVTDVAVEGDRLRFTAVGTAVPVDLDALTTRGQCAEPPAEGEGTPPA